MLLWNDNETDTTGEVGPADSIKPGIGTPDSVIPKFLDPALPIARQGAQFYTDLKNVAAQIDSSIVVVDNGMQSIINQMGQGETLSRGIRENFANAALAIIQLGGSEKEALAIQTETLDVLGRNVTLNEEQYKTIFATTKVTGQSAKDLETAFLDIGGSIDQVTEGMLGVIEVANSLGVNAKAVSEKVVENMEQLNRFGFQGGIEGLARMAAKAQVLRFDMSEVFELADDLMSPEKAIEMASALQRLGATTTSLIDPLRLMDLAQNDVGELQNQLGELFKTYTYFDEETKRFQIMPSARRDLKQLSQDLGIPLKEIEKMALGAADLDRKISEIDLTGLDADEDTKEMIANMATMNKEGKYVIRNEQGVDEDVSDFISRYADDSEGLKNFLQGAEDDAGMSAEDKMLKRADDQLSTLKRIEAQNEAAAKSMPLKMAGSDYAAQLLKFQEEASNKINGAIIAGFSNQEFTDKLNNAAGDLSDAAQKIKEGDFKGGLKLAKESVKEVGVAMKDAIADVGAELKRETGIKIDFTKLVNDFAAEVAIGLANVMNHFENPGTLKVTIYGDKTGNPNKLNKSIDDLNETSQETNTSLNKKVEESTTNKTSQEKNTTLNEQINQNTINDKLIKTSQEKNTTLNEEIKQSKINTNEFNLVDNTTNYQKMFDESIKVFKENFEITEERNYKSKKTGEEFTKEQINESFEKVAEKIINNIQNYNSDSLTTNISNVTNNLAAQNEQVFNDFSKAFGDILQNYNQENNQQNQESNNQYNINRAVNEKNQPTVNPTAVQNQPVVNQPTANQVENTYSVNENFTKFIEQQKSEFEKTKETIEKVFVTIKEGYTQTEKGTFISKETGEEKTQQELVQIVQSTVKEKIETTRSEFFEGLKYFKESQGEMGKNINVENLIEITQTVIEPLNKMMSSFEPAKIVSSAQNNFENNNLVTNANEAATNNNTDKSVISYINEEVQPLASQTSTEVSRIISQSNDSIVTSLSNIDTTNKELILNNTELNNSLKNSTESEKQVNDNYTTVVDNLVRENNTTRILQNENNTVTGELVEQPQVPTLIQSQTPTYQPFENNIVEKYFETIEKTTIEQKNGKVEQTVKFDSPLPIKIEVTGIQQNNKELADAFLGWIKTDRRFQTAFVETVTPNGKNNPNYNLVEKLK